MTPSLSSGNCGSGEIGEMAVERHTGASMMEQLVPEITTHALSYLDYPSLCRLSMTNSHMRKAANDDNAWKALYHKDFTLEQDSVTPVNGWKAYYASTRAIVNTNAEFFRIIRERSLPAMGQFWLNVDYVKCFHATGESFTGFNSVMESWQIAFSWENVADFQIRDVRARVLTDMAWVTMKAYLDMEAGPFNVTNVYEFHNGRWYMVHHHSSALLIHGGGSVPVHSTLQIVQFVASKVLNVPKIHSAALCLNPEKSKEKKQKLEKNGRRNPTKGGGNGVGNFEQFKYGRNDRVQDPEVRIREAENGSVRPDLEELSDKRRVTISDFRGKTLVSMREYYKRDGKELPTAKGISLTAEQWSTFKKNVPAIEKAIKKMESR
ncbi:F-box protein SKIP8 [Abeliophyllum distichum]|uniref:F-box protein SKIP8 n=1 Tax=Abeliophyllum distichum TaxID=126358 RepID=A0ABD1URQ8_9LAMI